MKNKIENHYQEDYYKYQKDIAEFGGRASHFLFSKHIEKTDSVLDFGCGSGFLLKFLDCKYKTGVELNPVARNFCNEKNSIICYESIDEIPDNTIDVVISNHCLEHTTSPYHIIEKIYQKLKVNGKLIIVVPLDSYKYQWSINDIDNHLYSFSTRNIGNLLQGCNFKDINTSVILHKWPPFYKNMYNIFGNFIFHQICWIYGRFNRRIVQCKAIGVKRG